MEWIAKDSSQKRSFPMQKKGLIEKFSELSSLTDVEAGMIIYKPGELHLEVWPNIPEAMRIFSKYSTEKENQELISKHQLEKIREQLFKLILENCKLETILLLSDYLERKSIRSLNNIKGVSCLALFLAMRIDQLTKRMDIVMEKQGKGLHGKKAQRRRYLPKVSPDPSYRLN